MIEKTHKTWDAQLMELQFAYNTATSSSTGHSPAYLNLGRELKPPGSLAHEVAAPETEKRQHWIKKLHAALELARAQMAKSFQRQMKHYNLRRLRLFRISHILVKKLNFVFSMVLLFN